MSLFLQPGLENLGADAVVAGMCIFLIPQKRSCFYRLYNSPLNLTICTNIGGIVIDPNIPAGMEFIPSSVPDGQVMFDVASTGDGGSTSLSVQSPCMTFEDYYAKFSSDSHPSFSVSPSTGRMDRRKGEPTLMQINCAPNGASGTLTGDLVINLPEDNSKICYKVTVNSM